MRIRLLLLLGWFLLFCEFAQAQTGTLQGRVYDAVTNEPLGGATVQVPEVQKGAYADSTGRFTIRDIPLGTYTVKANYIGYAPNELFEIRLEAGVTQLDIPLRPQYDSTETIEVVTSGFNKGSQELVSTRTIGLEQIQSNPGGNQDISRAIQSLPGVTSPTTFRNDVIVRGGAPNENVFYLDGIEIPNINHFATQGSGGGPVGIINSNLLQSVTFQTSNFGAQYDNTLSSVLAFELKEGNRERFQTTFTVSATEAGLTFDTPIGNKVTALVSVRRSYLQFLFDAIGLPFLPDYWDVAGKLKWDINERNSLTYIRIGAIDDFSKNSLEDVDPEQAYVLDGLPSIVQNSYTQGVSWKHLMENGFLTLAASRSRIDNRVERFRPFTEDSIKTQDFQSLEAENKLRLNVTQRLGKWELIYGGVFQFIQVDNESELLLGIYNPQDSSITEQRVGSATDFTYFRYGVHAALSRAFFGQRLRTTLGIRSDMNSFTETGNEGWRTLSPRFSFAYALTDKFSLTGGAGIYYKLPPNTVLAYENDAGENTNDNVAYIRSTHYVAGIEYQPERSLLFSVEGFLKQYDDYPVSVRDGISLANLGGDFGVFGNENVVSTGQGRAYGVEFLAQKRLTNSLYGIASYTLYWSEFDNGEGTELVRSAWDNRHLISLTGGWRFGKNKTWELAARYRYLGGSPYTPYDLQASRQVYLVRGEGVLDYTRINSQETNGFNQLDLRLDKKWFFKKFSLNLFLDIQNVLNLYNEAPPQFTLERNPANTGFDPDLNPQLVEVDAQSILPSIGIRLKF